MKFVIEALGLTAGGGKALAVDLLSSLPRHTEHQFALLLPAMSDYAAIGGSNLKVIPSIKPRSLLARYLFLNCTVPRICVEERAHALLCLGNFVPYRSPCSAVVLLQNAGLVYPYETRLGLTLRERLILAYGRWALRKLCRQVHLIVQTELVRRRLVSRYNLNPRQIHVIPTCLSFSDSNLARHKPIASESGSSRPFTFLCLTHYYAHKNLEVLVRAMGRLATYSRHAIKVLITIHGDQHPRARMLLEDLARKRLERTIVNIGPVSRARLAEVYRSANAMILPTLLESYSRTYLEAMHFGLPILTSDRNFARHICQDAALYFDPLDPDSVAQAIVTVIENSRLRRDLVANGERILQQLPSGDKIVARFVEVLERAANPLNLSPWVSLPGESVVSGEAVPQRAGPILRSNQTARDDHDLPRRYSGI